MIVNLGWLVVAARLFVCLLVWAAILPGPASSTPLEEPKRVMMLHSFGRDFLPWSEYALNIKAELERQSPWPLDIQEHTLLTARFNNPGPEAPFVDYLKSLYSGRPPDIVLSIGAHAAEFFQKYRAQLFPETPMVPTAVEQRMVNRTGLTDNDTVVSVYNDFLGFFGSILQVLPDTQTIAVVIGASPLEKFWLDEAKREAKPFENRVAFVWNADLSFEEILKRAAALPPHTVLFWGLMSVDAAGVAREGDLALRGLHAVANARSFPSRKPFSAGKPSAARCIRSLWRAARPSRPRSASSVARSRAISRSSRSDLRLQSTTGAKCSAGGSARATCLREARSCFASRASGKNIVGRWR